MLMLRSRIVVPEEKEELNFPDFDDDEFTAPSTKLQSTQVAIGLKKDEPLVRNDHVSYANLRMEPILTMKFVCSGFWKKMTRK